MKTQISCERNSEKLKYQELFNMFFDKIHHQPCFLNFVGSF